MGALSNKNIRFMISSRRLSSFLTKRILISTFVEKTAFFLINKQRRGIQVRENPE